MKRLTLGLLVSTYLLGTTITSADTHKDLDSHEHGASMLNIVIENNALFIEFESPWMNLVGFEHEPSTKQQKTLLAHSMSTLELSDTLFLLNSAAECIPAAAVINSSIPETEAEHDDTSHETSHNDHDEEQDHDSHSEVLVEYHFTCNNPKKLKTLSTTLFTQWPGIAEIDVQLAGPGGQSTVELVPGNSTIDLSEVR